MRLPSIDANVLPADERPALARMLADDVRARREAANRRDAEAWARVKTRADWEAFYRPRIEALRRSLGVFPPAPADLRARVTRTLDGEGYRLENIVFESRPGVRVTANLYLPSPPRERMPAILIVHSHHNPKTQGELQDMGMTWARTGCAVLVMDQLGYGERREHAEGPRQDYRFRALTGIQLQVLGDSLMGWMVWDVMRGVDLLLGRGGIDRERIILLGAVAGGGDPAAVAAALDPRIACAVPFNFGGPQPETPYPLPADARESFNYMGSGSWESTRNLRLSGRDGFLPWVIVASIAPRRLIYAHEFSWDRERDPVWERLQAVFALYGVPSHLAFAHGAGVLSGQPPEATHCNNVGAVHRRMIYPHLERWFGIPIPEQEYQERRPPEELACLPPEAVSPRTAAPRPLLEIFREIGAARADAARAVLAALPHEARQQRLRKEWSRLLGEVEPAADPRARRRQSEDAAGVPVERIVLEVEPTIVVPLLLLRPRTREARFPAVIGLAQDGKEAMLRERTSTIAALLERGVAVCLPDVRGTGETRPASSRERQSAATSLSATEWMLGGTLLGARLRDLRSVIRYVSSRPELDGQRLALWGDSLTLPNPTGFPDPLLGEGEAPRQSEPLGGLLALLGALYEDNVRAVIARGTLAGYEAVLRDRFCYLPHDAVVPGALTAGDLCDIAAALAPRPLRLEALVDGRNCLLPAAELQRLFEPTLRAYAGSGENLALAADVDDGLAAWLTNMLEQR